MTDCRERATEGSPNKEFEVGLGQSAKPKLTQLAQHFSASSMCQESHDVCGRPLPRSRAEILVQKGLVSRSYGIRAIPMVRTSSRIEWTLWECTITTGFGLEIFSNAGIPSFKVNSMFSLKRLRKANGLREVTRQYGSDGCRISCWSFPHFGTRSGRSTASAAISSPAHLFPPRS